MPLRVDISAFFIAEYERFMGGLEGLIGPDEAERRARDLRLRIERGESLVVRVPRWDDVVRLTPRVPISGPERVAHFRALREGRPSPLRPEQVAELDRRRGIARAIRDAAQPRFSQSFGAILTALDNVQDFFSTVASLARLAYWGVRIGAPRLAKRLIPGIGWVLGVADLLNLLAFMGLLALPAFAAICFGSRAALAAGLPALLFGRALKQVMGGFHGLNPFSRRARLKRRLRIARRLPGLGAAIEVLQTTDQLFGVGLSFGAIVGAIVGGAFAFERGLRGEPIVVRTPPAARPLHTLLAPKLARKGLRDIEERERAAAILTEAPMLLADPDLLGEELYVEALVSYAAALDLTAELLRGEPWQELAGDNGALGLTVPARVREWDPGLRAEALELQGTDDLWAVPGTPGALGADELLELGASRVPEGLRRFLEPRRDTLLAMFVGATVDRIVQSLYLLFEEDPELLAFELVPDWRVIESLADANRLVNISDPPEAIWSCWQAARERAETGPGAFLSAEELEALAADAGVQLIPIH
ncbi:MAG: hypothetical protein ACE5JH_12565, partial [Acidobacteriota bacterium]